jgi:hypothetical protein
VSTRASSITLVLREDMRVDDLGRLIGACLMFEPVLRVVPNEVDPAYEAVRCRFAAKLRDELQDLEARMLEVKP